MVRKGKSERAGRCCQSGLVCDLPDDGEREKESDELPPTTTTRRERERARFRYALHSHHTHKLGRNRVESGHGLRCGVVWMGMPVVVHTDMPSLRVQRFV